MPVIPWSDMLSVGVKDIDNQHRVLVGLLNQLGDVVQGQAGEWDQSAVLTALVDYTHTHFQFEEELMRRAGYAETDRHVQQHHDLVQAVAALVDAEARGEQADPQAMVVFLRDWLTGHIMGSDRVLGQALNAQGVR